MKVKDLIKQLQQLEPEETIVMKNLQANPLEDPYVLLDIRAYSYNGQVLIDGYNKRFI